MQETNATGLQSTQPYVRQARSRWLVNLSTIHWNEMKLNSKKIKIESIKHNVLNIQMYVDCRCFFI